MRNFWKSPYSVAFLHGCVLGFQWIVPGTVHFVGLHVSKGTPRLGVELDAAVGKLDGEQGQRCSVGFGCLLLSTKYTSQLLPATNYLLIFHMPKIYVLCL